MDRIEIRNARGLGIYLAIVGLASILAGILIFKMNGFFEILAVLFGLVLVGKSLPQIFDRRPQIILDEIGISGKRTKGVVIPWRKIFSVERKKKWLIEVLEIKILADNKKTKMQKNIKADSLDLPVLAIERIITRKAGLNASPEKGT